MLTAKEARVLTETSARVVTGYVHLALNAVKAEAELGNGKKAMYCLPWEAKPEYDSVKATLLQEKIAHELKLLGYTVYLEREGPPYVPRGLEEGSQLHYNEVLVVYW